jgi:hypothetical protein
VLGDKEQVALHQPDGNRIAGCFEDAEAGCLGDGFLVASLLLFCLECRIRRGLLLTGVVDGAFGIGTDGTDFAFLCAFGNDGLGGVLAGFVLRPVALRSARICNFQTWNSSWATCDSCCCAIAMMSSNQ